MDNYLNIKTEDHIFHITLDRGKSNAMELQMVNQIIAAIEQAEEDPAIEALVLSGKESFFSAGLDLIALFEYDEVQMEEFWKSFMQMVQKLASCTKPTVAAITGHSPAGGCVLALCCDYRIMAEGEYVIGLNEIPVGIVVPESIFRLYSFWLGEAVAYRSLMVGKLFNPQEALATGLVDEVVDFARIQTAASRRVKSVTQFERKAWRLSKGNMRKSIIAALENDQEQAIEQVLKQWWTPSTRAIMKTIIDNLTQKK